MLLLWNMLFFLILILVLIIFILIDFVLFYFISFYSFFIPFTGGSHLSRIFWEHENLSGLSIIRLIQLL